MMAKTEVGSPVTSSPPSGTATPDPARQNVRGHRRVVAPPIELPQAPRPGEGARVPASDRALGKALKPAIEEVILDTLRENPRVVIEIVYPVLGRAIRKAIAGALQGLVRSIESQAANVFSTRRLRWRWQALTTDRSYAEIVLANSVVYSIDEILLIHRETGLLMLHASRDSDLARDADLVSSMLTAIEDFARDSFDLDADESLSEFTMADQTVVIRTSPLLVLAAAVTGNPTQKVKDQFDELLEDIHRDYREKLESFAAEGDIEPFISILTRLEANLKRETGAGAVI